MSVTPISSIETLCEYLHAAIRLEHATLPVYLTALASLRRGQNLEAVHVLRSLVVDKVRRVTLAANLLNAVGGKVNLNQPGFTPRFPALFPDGESDLEVNLQAFSPDALETLLKVERSTKAASESGRLVTRPKRSGRLLPTVTSASGEELHFFSIREFYDAIEVGMEHLCASQGENKVFTGDRSHQVTPEFDFSGGGEIVPVYDLASAKVALRMIAKPDEGFPGSSPDFEKGTSAYYRLDQIKKGRFYQPGDQHDQPTGRTFEVNWAAVYPVMKNARLSNYPEDSEAYRVARDYQREYQRFLNELSDACAGQPQDLIPTVAGMFRLQELAYQLTLCPIPGGSGLNAAPLFSW